MSNNKFAAIHKHEKIIVYEKFIVGSSTAFIKSRLLIIALVASFFVNATPSTQIWIPSTDIQTGKTAHLGIDNYTRIKTIDGLKGAGIYDFGLTLGVFSSKSINVEVGVDYLTMGDEVYDKYPVFFNAKVGTPEGALFKNSPAIAVGAYNVGTKKNLTNYNIVYGLIAKTIPVVGRLSGGYYFGNKHILTNEKAETENEGLLLSWDRSMTEISDKLWLAVDYQGSKSYLGALNLGFSWSFSPNVSIIFAYDVYNNSKVYYNSKSINVNSFTTQLDINISKSKKKDEK